MSAQGINELIDLLVADAKARGADRLTVGPEVDAGPLFASCWRGEAQLQRRELAWRFFDVLGRHAMLTAGLDPWQFRRPQTGTAAGRFSLTVEGPTVWQRRLTFRPDAELAADASASKRIDEVLAQLKAEAAEVARAQDAAVEDSLLAGAFVEPDPTTTLVNLMLKQALALRAQRIDATALGAEFSLFEGTRDQGIPWGAARWPDIRRRLLHMSGFPPWARGPALGRIAIRMTGGREAEFTVEVLEGDTGVVLTVTGDTGPGAPSPPDGLAPAAAVLTELSPLLAAVLEAPSDVTARRVYADWLSENGDSRGRFIGLQLAEGGHRVPAPREAAQWCGAIIQLAGAWRMDWGFLDRVIITADPGQRAWDAVVADPHWATVRALSLVGLSSERAAQLLANARLSALEALAVERPPSRQPAEGEEEGPPPAVLERVSALRLSVINEPVTKWADALSWTGLKVLELALDGLPEEAGGQLFERQLARFFALKAARRVADLVIDARLHEALWAALPSVPATVQRVTVPFVAAEAGPFAPAVNCTLRRDGRSGSFSDAALCGELDPLYRFGPKVLPSLRGLTSLERVQFVSSPRALDRGREAVLRRLCAEQLPGVRVEVTSGESAAPLWWQEAPPARR